MAAISSCLCTWIIVLLSVLTRSTALYGCRAFVALWILNAIYISGCWMICSNPYACRLLVILVYDLTWPGNWNHNAGDRVRCPGEQNCPESLDACLGLPTASDFLPRPSSFRTVCSCCSLDRETFSWLSQPNCYLSCSSRYVLQQWSLPGYNSHYQVP